MTAWRLTLSSFAALSSSSSMEAVKSIFTRWMGFLIWPELVKKLETSLPRSAFRAMDSADMFFFLRVVVFIFVLPRSPSIGSPDGRTLLQRLRESQKSPNTNGRLASRSRDVERGDQCAGRRGTDERKPPALPRSRFRALDSAEGSCSAAHRRGIARVYNCYTILDAGTQEKFGESTRLTPA